MVRTGKLLKVNGGAEGDRTLDLMTASRSHLLHMAYQILTSLYKY